MLVQGLMPTLGLLFLVLADVLADQCENCVLYVGFGCIAMVIFAIIGNLWVNMQSSKSSNTYSKKQSKVLEGGNEALLITVTRD